MGKEHPLLSPATYSQDGGEESERAFLEARLKALKGLLRGVQREVSALERRLLSNATSQSKRT